MPTFSKIASIRLLAAIVVAQISFLLPGAVSAQVTDGGQADQHGHWAVVTLDSMTEGQEIESYKVAKGMVAWTVRTGDTRELHTFDGTTTYLLATMDAELWDRDVDNGFFMPVEGNYDIGSGQVVWTGTDGLDREIYSFSGGTTRMVSDNTYDDRHPVVSAGRIAWTSQPSSIYNLMISDSSGMYRLDSWHVPNYAFSGEHLYWLNKLPNENWFRVFVNDGASTKAIGEGDDRPIPDYFLTDGKGSAAWEYSTKQWSYDKRRVYRSYKGYEASLIVQRDVPPNVTYIEDMDGTQVILSVHDLLTTKLYDHQFMIGDGGTLKTMDDEISPTKARFMDDGFIRHLVAENGSALIHVGRNGSGQDFLSLKNVVYEVFDADGPTAAGAVLNGNVLLYQNGETTEIGTAREVRAIEVAQGDVAWIEGSAGQGTLRFAATGVLVKTAAGSKLVSGKLVKTPAYSSVYLAGTDGMRYAFPSEGEFFGWYDDFSSLQTVSAEDLAAIPLSGNVLYAPGSALLKVASSPKVYMIDTDGSLHWVTGEDVLIAMVGNDWQSQIRNVPEALFAGYTIGEPIGDTYAYRMAFAN